VKTVKPKPIPESQIQKEIKEYLQWKGWYVYKNHQSLGSHRGLFDLTAIKNGRVVWIEVKTPRGKVSPFQEQFMKEIREHGGDCIVAKSIDDLKEMSP
jgi:Holliday junction resolvase